MSIEFFKILEIFSFPASSIFTMKYLVTSVTHGRMHHWWILAFTSHPTETINSYWKSCCPPEQACFPTLWHFLLVYRCWLNRRQIDGSLNRTPAGFYDRVWQILERTPNGIIVAGKHLPQVQPLYLCHWKGFLAGCNGVENSFPLWIADNLLIPFPEFSRKGIQIPDGRNIQENKKPNPLDWKYFFPNLSYLYFLILMPLSTKALLYQVDILFRSFS